MSRLANLLRSYMGTAIPAPIAVGVKAANRHIHFVQYDCHCSSDDCVDTQYDCHCSSDDCVGNQYDCHCSSDDCA